jgi:hypothetical protein
MPEHNIAGGDLWLHLDEQVVATIDAWSGAFLGIVTTRASGLIYASLVGRRNLPPYRFDVPQWVFTQLERSICHSIEEASPLLVDAAGALVKHNDA